MTAPRAHRTWASPPARNRRRDPSPPPP